MLFCCGENISVVKVGFCLEIVSSARWKSEGCFAFDYHRSFSAHSLLESSVTNANLFENNDPSRIMIPLVGTTSTPFDAKVLIVLT